MANHKVIFDKFIHSPFNRLFNDKEYNVDKLSLYSSPYYNLRDQFVFRYYIFKHAADQRRGKTLKWQDLTK